MQVYLFRQLYQLIRQTHPTIRQTTTFELGYSLTECARKSLASVSQFTYPSEKCKFEECSTVPTLEWSNPSQFLRVPTADR